MSYILTFDQGTTSSRAIVFNRSGEIVTVARQEFTQIFPRPGWVEHNPDEIWQSQLAVARQALDQAGIAARDIVAIGITNQRETTVVWDRRTGRPLTNAIVWQDRRTAEMCDALREAGKAEMIREKTGLVPDAYFSATKIHWILENIPQAREKAEAGELAFGTVDSWLLWKLTGGEVHATDASNASRTLLLNIHTGEWDDALLSLFAIPRSMLPEVRSSAEVYGETAPELLGAPIPVAGMAGDQQAALFGQVCHQPGMVKNTYGTGCFLLMYTGEEAIHSSNNLLTTIAWQLDGQLSYALEGSVFIAGAVVQWLRDGLGIIQSSGEIEPLARQVTDTDGVYLVPAFAGLGAPHWDPYARGTLVGITRGTTASHIARAALESMAHQTADVLEAMEADAGIRLKDLRADGGATVNNLLMQIQADLLGAPVIRPRISETTALGAAYLAGLAMGYWSSEEEIAAQWEEERRFLPRMPADRVEQERHNWKRAVERAKGWIQ